jgi:predicted phage tail protein
MDQRYIINLYGKLKKEYGATHEIYASSFGEAIRGLVCACGNELKETLRVGNWHITNNDARARVSKNDKFLSQTDLQMPLSHDVINIYPEIRGSGGKPGLMGIIMGVLMIAAIFLLPAAGVALAAGTAQMLAIGGAFAIIGGIITMATTNTPKVGNYDNQSVDKKKSFIYNGPVNVMEQGGAVPLVYGRHLCGSTVISSSIDVEQRL